MTKVPFRNPSGRQGNLFRVCAHVLSFIAFTKSAPCPAVVTNITVSSTAEASDLSEALLCSGAGDFEVEWSGEVLVTRTISVSNSSSLKITGVSGPAAAVIDGGETTQLFVVQGESYLEVDRVLLTRGLAAEGAAVSAMGDSQVRAVDCSFSNNNASTQGGALYVNNSDVNIEGNTSFVSNAEGAIYITGGALIIDGETSFSRNRGGGISTVESNVSIAGKTSFASNIGPSSAVEVYDGVVVIDGETSFSGNEASSAIAMTGGALVIDGETSFSGNQGGAIQAVGSSQISIAGITTFSNNSETRGGAIYIISASVSIDGESSFSNNTASSSGGAVYMVGGELNISGVSCFQYNQAVEGGGAVYLYPGTLAVSGVSSFMYNEAQDGGAIYITDGGSFAFHGDTLFQGNSQGAISIYYSSAGAISGTTSFVRNTRDTSGGAVYMVLADFFAAGSTRYVNNSAGERGGACYASSSNLRSEGLTEWVENNADLEGGALYVREMDVFLGEGRTVFSRNHAAENGGAISAVSMGFFNISNFTTFVENMAEQDGGAVYFVDGTLVTERNASFWRNTAVSGSGGGIYASNVVATFNNTLFIGNSAVSGGGMALFSSGSVSITDAGDELRLPTSTTGCIFANNSADDGGAIYSAAGFDIIQDSVFESNLAAVSGGGLLHSGVLVGLHGTAFYENRAGEDGLAIMSLGVAENFTDVTFAAHTFFCPAGEYGVDVNQSDDEVSHTCRFEVVCSRCTSSCEDSEVLLGGVDLPDASSVPICRVLPEGVKASATAGTTLEMLDLERGYYRTSAESQIVSECLREEACDGGANAGEYCAAGYKGAYCAVCEEDYAPGLQYSCNSCLGDNKRSAIGVAAALLSAAFLIVGLAIMSLVEVVDDRCDAEPNRKSWRKAVSSWRERIWKAVPLSAIKTLFVVWQIVTQFASVVDVQYPDVYERFLSPLNVMNFNLGLFFSFFCVLDTNFYGRLFFSTLVPLVVLGGLTVTHAVAKRNNRASLAGVGVATRKHLSIALFVMFAVYSSVSFTVFQTFVCETLDDEVQYLRADYSLTCTTGIHTAMKAYAGVMVMVYPLGIPAVFAWGLFSRRHELIARVEGGRPADNLEPMRDLWEPYKPNRYYYEIVECGRRIILTGLAVFIYPGSAAQVAIEVAFAAGLLVMFEVLAPFVNPVDSWLYRTGTLVVFFSMYLALLLKVDASDESSQSQEIFASLLVAAHVGMVLMVLVNAICAMRQTPLGSFVVRRVRVRDIPVAGGARNPLGQSLRDDADECKETPRQITDCLANGRLVPTNSNLKGV